MGFIWQQTARNLLPFLTAAENVELPMAVVGVRRAERIARAEELLDGLGLAEKMHRRPAELSGGEQQRVAIATALANRPKVLLADEPTGELDRATGDEVFAALREVNASLGTTVVIVTHDAGVSSQVRRTVAIRDGRTSSEVLRRDAGGPAEEFALIDRVGRMQVPAAYRQALGLRDRVRLELEPDHLGVWPDTADTRGDAG